MRLLVSVFTLGALWVLTLAVQLVFVVHNAKRMPLRDARLQLFNQGLFKLLDFTAVKTDEMVVVRIIIRQLVTGHAVTELVLVRDAARGEHL